MGKFRKKTKKTWFKKGHYFRGNQYVWPLKAKKRKTVVNYIRNKIIRLTQLDFQRITKSSSDGMKYRFNSDSAHSMLLRPKHSGQKQICEEYLKGKEAENEMRLLNPAKVTKMWNQCTKEHKNKTYCDDIEWYVIKEKKDGLCWTWTVACENCRYKSSPHKLYNEIPSNSRGPNAGVPNVALQVGLQDTTISNTKARYLLAATHIPPPCRSAMQRLSNKVSTAVVELNSKDMENRRKKINELTQSVKGKKGINIGLDARYNSTTYGSSYKCGQNASQAIMTAVSQEGDEKEIINLYVENKLCWGGAWLRSRGFDCKCPGHPGCTATQNRNRTLSEYDMGIKIGQNFSLDRILIEHVVTDGDSRSSEGINESIQTLDPNWKVLRQSDSTHLGMSQYKKTLKCDFSRSFFPEHLSTQVLRKELQKTLGEDIKTRCHITFKNLFEQCDGDVKKMAVKLSSIVKMLVACYSGDHKLCKKSKGQVIGCQGGKSNNWFQKSMYFNTLTYRLTRFSMTKKDRKLLKEIIKMKLGFESLQMLKLNLNTNKNESVHRAYSASAPKNIKFGRNLGGRVHSAAHRINNRMGDSLHLKLQMVGADIPKGGRVARAINQIQKESVYHNEYRKRKIVKKRKSAQKSNQRYEYNVSKKNKRAVDMYKKGLLDTYPSVDRHSARKKQTQSHSYSESYWCV